MALIPSLKALTLDLPPSCIAFCPSRPQFFVVGTYLLHPRTGDDGSNISDAGRDSMQQVRTGSLILFRLGDDDVM
jgi:diphthine methyl ester acylhydrolase